MVKHSFHADVVYENNILYVRGEINFSNIMSAFYEGMKYLHECTHWRIDCGRLKDVNTAMLILILEWIKLANKTQKEISLLNIPQGLINIANVSRVDELILKYYSA